MSGNSRTDPQSGLEPGSRLNAAETGRHAAAHHGTARARQSPKPSAIWPKIMVPMKNSTIAVRNGSLSPAIQTVTAASRSWSAIPALTPSGMV